MESKEMDIVIALLKTKNNNPKIPTNNFERRPGLFTKKKNQSNCVLPSIKFENNRTPSLLGPKININFNNKFNNINYTDSKLVPIGKQEKLNLNFKKFSDLTTNSKGDSKNISSPSGFNYNESKSPQKEISNSVNTTQPEFTLVQKQITNCSIFNPKIRFLNFRPFVDLPKYITDLTQSKIKQEDEKNLNLNDKIQYYFKVFGNDCPLIINLLEDNGLIQCGPNSKNFTILWSSGYIKLQTYHDLTKWQRLNHFPRSHELTRKDCLYKNIAKFQAQFPNSRCNFVPMSFILPNEKQFLEEEMSKNKDQVWIIKPCTLSQGRGIFLTKSLLEIPSNVHMIACKYISNPFLINKKKFDLRVYVLVTSICPLRIYRYSEGLVRFATDDYNSNINDRCSHLTNYAVNKRNSNYIKNSDPYETDFSSSKWNFTGFKKYLDINGIDSAKVFESIDDLVIKTIIACENPLLTAFNKNANFTENCFELYGFDVLLDSNLNPWLMEVNLSPNLHYDAPIDLKIKGEMIAEIFDMIRIVPYDLRNDNIYAGCNINNIITGIRELKDYKINKEFKEYIIQTYEEENRIKNFIKLFPSDKYNDYKKFFDREREINRVLGIIETYRRSKK